LTEEDKERKAQVKAASRGRGRGRGRGVKKAPPMDWSQASPRIDTGLHVSGRPNRVGSGAAIKMEQMDSPAKKVTPIKQEPVSVRPTQGSKK
jgi:hypothetical protein